MTTPRLIAFGMSVVVTIAVAWCASALTAPQVVHVEGSGPGNPRLWPADYLAIRARARGVEDRVVFTAYPEHAFREGRRIDEVMVAPVRDPEISRIGREVYMHLGDVADPSAHVERLDAWSMERERRAGWPLPALRLVERRAWLSTGESTVAGAVAVGGDAFVGVPRHLWGSGVSLPVTPIWWGFLGNTVMTFVVLLGAARVAARSRGWVRARRGRCVGCGYPEAAAGCCPECGTPRRDHPALVSEAAP